LKKKRNRLKRGPKKGEKQDRNGGSYERRKAYKVTGPNLLLQRQLHWAHGRWFVKERGAETIIKQYLPLIFF
jgi:hypothetical protein